MAGCSGSLRSRVAVSLWIGAASPAADCELTRRLLIGPLTCDPFVKFSSLDVRRWWCAQRKRQDVERDDKEIAAAIRRRLTERLGQERFELWFGRLATISVEGTQVTTTAGTQFFADYLRNGFRQELQAAANETLGVQAELVFRVAEVDPPVSPTDTCATQPPPQAAQPQPAGGGSRPDGDASAESLRSTVLPLRPEPRPAAFTMETFVVGAGNRVAWTAAETMLTRLGAMSPLFLFGPNGCGKTHVLQAIAHRARRGLALPRVVLLSAEQFTTYFLEALRGSGLPNFRRRYRDHQLLLIDDVQFFAGKRATLVEVQQTIDALLRNGSQLVLTADRPLNQLTELGTELTARLAGGLVCGLEPADYATRLGIVRQLDRQRDLRFPDDVLELIASELSGDARHLIGALNRLQAHREGLGESITLDTAAAALADLFRTTRRMVRLADINQAVCKVFGIEPETLQSDSRSKAASQPRMLAMFLARKHTRAAYSEIGNYFGRTHSTVISAQQKVGRWVSSGTTVGIGPRACRIDDAIQQIESILRTG